MSNNKPSRLVFYATNPQKTLLHRLKRQAGMSEDDYRTMIYDASNGRTDSSRQLYKYEATQLIKRLLDPQGVNEKRQEEQARVVGQIFGISCLLYTSYPNFVAKLLGVSPKKVITCVILAEISARFSFFSLFISEYSVSLQHLNQLRRHQR